MKRIFLLIIFLLCFPALSRASSVSVLAASMTPGQWAELTPMTGWNNGVGPIQDPASVNDNINSFTDKTIWDSVTKKLFVFGQGHGGTSYMRMSIYDAATNTWSSSTGTNAYASSYTQAECGGWPCHTYNHFAGPRNGKLFYKAYSNRNIHVYDIATDTWSNGSIPQLGLTTPNTSAQLDYFPERDSLIFVDGDWGIWEYTFSNNTWTNIQATTVGNFHPMGDYENIGRYNPVRHTIFFGGGVVSGPGVCCKNYELTSGPGVINLADLPANYRLANSGVNGSGILAVDPASGKYIAFLSDVNTSAGAVYVLDASNPANPWILQPGGSNPPWFVGRNDAPVAGVVVASIPEYGVMIFVAENTNASKVYLYKFQAAVADTTPPTNVTGLSCSAANPTTINCTWNPAGDNVGVTSYDIYRSAGTCTPSVPIGSSGIP